MNKIVFKGKTHDGIPYLIRYPKRTDAQEMCRYINEFSKERSYISFQGEEISLADERKFLNSAIKEIKNNNGMLLLAIANDKVIGVSDIRMRTRISSHVGVFGISIAKDFRGKGIGKKIMECVLNEAKKNIKGLKLIELQCFGDNPVAPDLYKTFGFKEYGRLPKGINHNGILVDDIYMYLNVKS